MPRIFLSMLCSLALVGGCGDEPTQWTATETDQTMDWDDAVELLNIGETVEIFQSHERWVVLTQSDGTSVTTQSPELDLILFELDRCAACGEVLIAME